VENSHFFVGAGVADAGGVADEWQDARIARPHASNVKDAAERKPLFIAR
jgi:hypothetical protein